MLHFYDNTLKVKQEAQEIAKTIDWSHKGNEEQLFKVGDIVTAASHSCYKLDVGVIEKVENINGYYNYIIKGLNFKTHQIKKL